VAINNNGDFIIFLQSYGQEESDYDIYAQRYESGRNIIDGPTDLSNFI